MKKKLVLAIVVAAIMMLGLVGCGVKITNIAVPDAVTPETFKDFLQIIYHIFDW